MTEPIWTTLGEIASKVHLASQLGFGAGNGQVDQELLDAIGYVPTEEQHQHLLDLARVLLEAQIDSAARLATALGLVPPSKKIRSGPSDRRLAIESTKNKNG